MQLQDIPTQLPRFMGGQPVEIYDGDKLIAVALSPAVYEEKKARDVLAFRQLCDKVGSRTKHLGKQEIIRLLEIDDAEYEALGFGQ